MTKVLFLMDDTTHIDKTELLNKKYNTNGISAFLNKEFERQKAENNSLVEVIDTDFLEVLHNNYEADCFNSERLPEGVIGSYADFAKDFADFHDWQNQLVYDFAKADTDVVLAGNFIFFRFSKEQKKKWFSNKYKEFSKIIATVTAENFHEQLLKSMHWIPHRCRYKARLIQSHYQISVLPSEPSQMLAYQCM